jgi:hypothetical protein
VNIVRVLGAGIVASIVMGMVAMIYEAMGGAGFWSPVVFIAATVLRSLQSVPIPVPFHAAGVILGLMGHMMNSMILGLIFASIFSRVMLSRGALVGVGVAYALAVFLVMWFLIVPAIDPVMLKLNGMAFAIAHMMWGVVLGLIVPQSAEATARVKVTQS